MSRARAAPAEGGGTRGFPLALPRAAFCRLSEHHGSLRLARRMLGSPGAQQGEVYAGETSEREREKEAEEGASATHAEVGAGGAGGRRRRRRQAEGREERPLAGSRCSPSGRQRVAGAPRGANKAAGAPRRPLPPRRPRHAGPAPAPHAPAGAAGRARPALEDGGERGAEKWGETARAAGRAGAGFETARGPCGARGQPPPQPEILSFAACWRRLRSRGAAGPHGPDRR